MPNFSLKNIFGQNKRTALIRKNILFSFLIKGWSGLVQLLLVPLTLKCLGEYTNGVWLTIASLLLWIDNMDIGLGNGLRNMLATFVAQGDYEKARRAVSSTFLMLIFIIVPILIILIGVVEYADIYSFLNVKSSLIPDLRTPLIVALIFVCSNFIFKFIGNFYMGMQLLAVNNFLVVSAHTLALIVTWILYIAGSHSLLLIAIANTCTPLIVYLIAYPYTFFVRYPNMRPGIKYFDKTMISGVFNIGMKFFLLQMCGAILFMSSNLLISKLFTPAHVTPYQIAYRLFSIVMVMFTAVSNPYWSATTDAFARGDMEWIRNSKRRIERLLLILGGMMILMVTLSAPIYSVWIGNDSDVPFSMSLAMALYIFVLIVSLAYSNFLNGMGILRLQMICTVIAAIAFIPMAIVASHIYDNVLSILIVMIIVNLPGLIVNRIQLTKHLR